MHATRSCFDHEVLRRNLLRGFLVSTHLKEHHAHGIKCLKNFSALPEASSTDPEVEALISRPTTPTSAAGLHAARRRRRRPPGHTPRPPGVSPPGPVPQEAEAPDVFSRVLGCFRKCPQCLRVCYVVLMTLWGAVGISR